MGIALCESRAEIPNGEKVLHTCKEFELDVE
jgi:hypothetical protein